MNQADSRKATLVGSDILFECRQCGKSLVIDCRGAGLNIQCPQCENELEVPIPDGFDLSQLDKEITAEEDVPPAAPARGAVGKLPAELETLLAEKQQFIQRQADLRDAVKTISRQLDEFRKALDKFGAGPAPSAGETRKII